jgi:hypothetical protein
VVFTWAEILNARKGILPEGLREFSDEINRARA